MKIQINRSELLIALKLVASNLSSRLTPEVLNNVLIVAENEKLSISTFNGSQSIEIQLEAEVIERGKALVTAIPLRDLVAKFGQPELTLSSTESYLIIADSLGTASLKLTDLEELISPPELEDRELELDLESEIFALGIEQTAYCASKDEFKQVLMGINLRFNRDTSSIAFCATDAHRLATITRQIKADNLDEREYIVKRQTFNLLQRVLETIPCEKLRVVSDGSSISIKGDRFEIFSDLICADYPAYEKLIPTLFEVQAVFDRQQAVDNLYLISTIASDGVINIHVDNKNQQLLFTAENQNLGTGELKQQAETIGSEELFSCSVKCDYLLNTLKKLSGKEVRMMMNKDNMPIFINNLYPDQTDFILMPVQTKS